ncbi:antileukoproteinase isoform X2 [Globicephala melas]|uniref:antileukoproteinase isoform X2 n=1 Tax=Globicephala melas TaxID=9731 RepID=UPI00122F38F2|nr:antileukoproteinase-like isoform X2 [Globicephala melas]
MTFSGLFPFVLLALGTLAPWAVEGAGNALKAGDCPPRKPAQCLKYEKPKCSIDRPCPEKKKCCPDACGMTCLDPVNILNPVEEKPGKCPVFTYRCAMVNPPNRCETDSQCVGELKCCEGPCGKECLLPVKVEEKPGMCPESLIRCMMLNPPNRCETDSQCMGELKCCESFCGKECLLPVKA